MSENGAFLSSENGAFSQSENQARGGGEAPPPPTGHEFYEIEHTDVTFEEFAGFPSRVTFFKQELATPFWLERFWLGGGATQFNRLWWTLHVGDPAKDAARAGYEANGAVFTPYTHAAFYALPPWGGGDPRQYPIMSGTPHQSAILDPDYVVHAFLAEGRGAGEGAVPTWGLLNTYFPRYSGPSATLQPPNPSGDQFWYIKEDIGPDDFEVTSKVYAGALTTYLNSTLDVDYPAKAPTITIVGGGQVDTTPLARFTFTRQGVLGRRPFAVSTAFGEENNVDEVADFIARDVTGFGPGVYADLGGQWYWTQTESGINTIDDFYHPASFDPTAENLIRVLYGEL